MSRPTAPPSQSQATAAVVGEKESAVMRLKRAHEARAKIAEENRRKLEMERLRKVCGTPVRLFDLKVLRTVAMQT